MAFSLSHRYDYYDEEEETQYEHMTKLRESMLGEIEELYDSHDFCDINLVVGDKSYPTHKAFLAASSEKLKEMIMDMHEDQKTLELESLSQKGIEEVLFFIYRFFMNLDETNIEEVIQASIELKMKSAIEEICKHMKEAGYSDLVKNWQLMKTYQSKGIIVEGPYVKRIVQRFDSIMHDGRHFIMTKDELKEVLLDPNLNIEPEEKLLYGIMEWIDEDVPERVHYAPELYACCRLNLIPPGQLEYLASKIRYIKESAECMALIENAMFYHSLPVHQKIATLEEDIQIRNRRKATIVFGGTIDGVINHHCWGRQPENSSSDYWKQLPDVQYSFLGAGVTVINNFMLVCGGIHGLNVTNKCYVYDPRISAWSVISPMNKNRCYFPSFERDTTVVVFGGCEDTFSFVKNCEIEKYEPSIDKWSVIGSMPQPLWQHAACILDNKIYISGGYDQKGEAVRKFYTYNLDNQCWQLLPDLNTPRSSHHMIGVMDDIFIADSKTEEIEHFSLKENQWSKMTTWKQHRVELVKMPLLFHVIEKNSHGEDRPILLLTNGKIIEKKTGRYNCKTKKIEHEYEEHVRKCGSLCLSRDPKKSWYDEMKYFPEDIRDFLCCSLVLPSQMIGRYFKYEGYKPFYLCGSKEKYEQLMKKQAEKEKFEKDNVEKEK